MLKAREAQEVAHADGLLAQLQSLQQKTLEILARAECRRPTKCPGGVERAQRDGRADRQVDKGKWLGKEGRVARPLSTGHTRMWPLRI
jgi:hypothetical protein